MWHFHEMKNPGHEQPDPVAPETDASALAAAMRRRLIRMAIFLALAGGGALFLAAVALSISRPALSKMQGRQQESPAAWRMSRIGLALVTYAAQHDGRFPEHLSELHERQYLADLSWFEHPERPGTVPTQEAIDAGDGFPYLIPPGTQISTVPIPALREFREGGATMLISKRGIDWETDEAAGSTGQAD
jgi:hypothetical protein